MKRFYAILLVFVLLMATVCLTACGGSFTEGHKALHDAIEAKGGEIKYDDLSDNYLGSVDITVQSYSSSTRFYFWWKDGSSWCSMDISVYKDHASVYYIEGESKVHVSASYDSVSIYDQKIKKVTVNSVEMTSGTTTYNTIIKTYEKVVKNNFIWISAITSTLTNKVYTGTDLI